MSDLREIFRDNLPHPGYCLVLRPFGDEFDRVWATIRDALAETFYWIDVASLSRSGRIMEEILLAIARTDVVIVDVTTSNANVFYELGIAHMARGESKVIIVKQRASDRSEEDNARLPFDIAGDRYLDYKPTLDGIQDMLPELKTRIRNALERTSWFRLAEGSTYTSDAFSGPGGAYQFEVQAVAFLDRSVGREEKNFREGSVSIELTVRPYPLMDRSVPAVVSATLSSGAICKIPNLNWCLKFEYFESDRDQKEKDKAVICVIPAV
jgi:hypothetical protein